MAVFCCQAGQSDRGARELPFADIRPTLPVLSGLAVARQKIVATFDWHRAHFRLKCPAAKFTRKRPPRMMNPAIDRPAQALANPPDEAMNWEVVQLLARHAQHLQRGLETFSRDWLDAPESHAQPLVRSWVASRVHAAANVKAPPPPVRWRSGAAGWNTMRATLGPPRRCLSKPGLRCGPRRATRGAPSWPTPPWAWAETTPAAATGIAPGPGCCAPWPSPGAWATSRCASRATARWANCCCAPVTPAPASPA